MKIGLTEEIPYVPETLSDDLRNFILACLKRNSKDRPLASDLLNH